MIKGFPCTNRNYPTEIHTVMYSAVWNWVTLMNRKVINIKLTKNSDGEWKRTRVSEPARCGTTGLAPTFSPQLLASLELQTGPNTSARTKGKDSFIKCNQGVIKHPKVDFTHTL